MKKILILAIYFYIACITINTYAITATKETPNKNINQNIEDKEIVEGYIDERLRSLQLPTNSLNLSTQSYKANITSASNRWLYTDVYFKVASNKTIKIKYNLSSNNGQNAKIGIYDMTSESWKKITYGLVGTTSASGLDTTHKYAVAFAGNGTNTISGSAIITN